MEDNQELIAADVDFKPLVDNFIKVLREGGMNNTDISLYIKTPKGKSEFIQYCDACLRMELVARFGTAPEIVRNAVSANS